MKLFLTLLLATCALAAPQWPGAGSSGSGPPAGVGGPPKAGGWSPTASDSESELLTIEVLEEHDVSVSLYIINCLFFLSVTAYSFLIMWKRFI